MSYIVLVSRIPIAGPLAATIIGLGKSKNISNTIQANMYI